MANGHVLTDETGAVWRERRVPNYHLQELPPGGGYAAPDATMSSSPQLYEENKYKTFWDKVNPAMVAGETAANLFDAILESGSNMARLAHSATPAGYLDVIRRTAAAGGAPSDVLRGMSEQAADAASWGTFVNPMHPVESARNMVIAPGQAAVGSWQRFGGDKNIYNLGDAISNTERAALIYYLLGKAGKAYAGDVANVAKRASGPVRRTVSALRNPGRY